MLCPFHRVRYFDARGRWHLLVHRYRFGDGPGVAPSDNLVAGHGYNDVDFAPFLRLSPLASTTTVPLVLYITPRDITS